MELKNLDACMYVQFDNKPGLDINHDIHCV